MLEPKSDAVPVHLRARRSTINADPGSRFGFLLTRPIVTDIMHQFMDLVASRPRLSRQSRGAVPGLMVVGFDVKQGCLGGP